MIKKKQHSNHFVLDDCRLLPILNGWLSFTGALGKLISKTIGDLCWWSEFEAAAWGLFGCFRKKKKTMINFEI